jgi:hypothetical protein
MWATTRSGLMDAIFRTQHGVKDNELFKDLGQALDEFGLKLDRMGDSEVVCCFWHF